MAEVTRAATGLSSFSSKKTPSFSSHGYSSSSSSKHIYDDVFAHPKSSTFCSFDDDDYGDIFGSEKSANGSWVSPSSSIPIFELEPGSQQRGRPLRRGGGEGGIDYSGIFGGFGDDGFAVPDGKELFGQLKKKAKTTSSDPFPRSNGQTAEVTVSHITRQPHSGQVQTNGLCQSIENLEQVKHMNNGTPTDGTTSAGHVHDIPGSTCELYETVPLQKTQTSKSPVKKDDTELGMHANLAKKQEKPSKNATLDFGAAEQNSVHDASFQKSSAFSVSKSVPASYDTCQSPTIDTPSKIVKEDTKEDFNVKVDGSLGGLSDLDPNKKNSESDAGFHRASSLGGSTSVAPSHNTSQAAGPSNMVMDEAKLAFGVDVGKKKWRHSRMTSLDFGDHKRAHEHDARFDRKSRFGTSYSFDASHDPLSTCLKVQSSKAVPSSSLPQFFSAETHCKISGNSSGESSATNLSRGAGNSPPSFDEQLDVNSAAAVSVAALQRALQEAEKKIRLAKQFLECEGQSSTKLRFKDTLKTNVAKEDRHVNELGELQPLSFKDTLKAKVVKENKFGNDVNVVQLKKMPEDRIEGHSTMQSCLHPERQNVFDGQKKSTENEAPKDGGSSKLSELNEEGDKCEGGGEWEATKQLTQLISGVKTRLASFMAWNADTEKKGESEEIETSRKSLQPSEEIEPELKHLEVSEMKEAENNRNTSISASDTDNEENKIGLFQEASGPKENKSTMSTTLEQDKAGYNIHLIPDITGSTGEIFLRFTFMDERSHNLSDPEGEKQEGQQSRELHVEKREEIVLNEAKDECVKGKGEEVTQAGLDGSCLSQDSGTGNEDRDRQMEMAYSTGEHEKKDFIHEEESNRRPNKQHEEEPTDNSHSPENNIERNEKDAELEEYEVQKEAEDQLRGEPVANSYCPGNCIETIENDVVQEEEALKEFEVQQIQEANVVGERGKGVGEPEETYQWQESERDLGMPYPVESVNGEMPRWEENKSQSQTNHIVEVVEHASYIAADAVCKQTENVVLGKDEEACQIGSGNTGNEAAVFPDEKSDKILETHSSSEPKMEMGSPILPFEDVTGEMPRWEENKSQSLTNHIAEAVEVGSCIAADAECKQTETLFLEKDEEAYQISWGNLGMETEVFPDEESERVLEMHNSSSEPKMDMESPVLPDQQNEKMEIPNPSPEPKMDFENTVLAQKGSELIGEERVLAPASTENNVQFDGVECHDGTTVIFPCETSVLQDSETDANFVERYTDGELMGSKSDDFLKNQTDHLHACGKTFNAEGVASMSVEEGEKCSVEAVHRRRRWFENGGEIGATERPSILGGHIINLQTDQEAVEERDLAGSVEIHSIKIGGKTTEVSNAQEIDTALKDEDHRANVQATQKRRRWCVNKGEEGAPEPLNLFGGAKVTSDMDPEIVNESLPQNMSDNCGDRLNTGTGDSQNLAEADVVAVNELKDKQSVEAAPRRKRWFENGEKVGPAQHLRMDEEAVMPDEINEGRKAGGDKQKCGNIGNTPVLEEDDTQKVDPVSELHRDPDAVNRERKEKEKERIAVERAICEARERAFAEARERARRDAAEIPNAEARQGAGGAAQDRTGKVFAEASSSFDGALAEAKLRAERAAVERATSEARQRALQKALSEKAAAHRSKEQDPKFYSSSSFSSSSYSSSKAENFDGVDVESPQRHKARLERQKRTMEQAAKALEEKNNDDLLAQKEQAARNMMADSLDAEVKRWSCGKEGNLRALLSTLQYILGPESGWQAVSLTDLMEPAAIRKAYKKANLSVHPDKLQQRGATSQQKYICEKVFDLLKEAWSEFNP